MNESQDHSHHGHHHHHHRPPSTSNDPMGHMDMTGEHNHSSHGMMGHAMSMAFHFGETETILFSFWRISTITGLVGSMVGIFLMAALYEGLKVLREYLQQKELAKQLAATAPPGQPSDGRAKPTTGRCAPLSLAHGVQTLLHMLQLIVSYFLMLIFMTYNVWLCAAVVAGAGVGYFCFGWRRRIVLADAYEHCH